MNGAGRHTIRGIGEMKFLLILGVVLIHCNLANDFEPAKVETSPGLELVRWISTMVCQGCVPCFFLLSAYLMFNGLEKFTPHTYADKLRRRAGTLLIPYLIWCTLCAAGLYIEHEFLHKSGLGIFLDNGSVDWQNLLKGYWAIEAKQDMPLAPAFWFIRNLMVFVVLSPIAYALASRWWLTGALFAVRILSGINFGGFEWYVAGAFLATSGYSLPQPGRYAAPAALSAFAICSAALYFSEGAVYRTVAAAQTVATLFVTAAGAMVLERAASRSRAVATLIEATFMIYALHQCFSTSTRHLWEGLIGVDGVARTLAAYCCTLLTLTGISIAVYLPMRRFTPRLLSLLTGGR